MANINNVMGQPQAFSYDVPMQANMIGTAKPVFNQQTMGMAEAAFGNPAMRQASVGAPFQANAFYAALNDAKEKGAKTLGIVNVVGSTITREVDSGIYLHAGPEMCTIMGRERPTWIPAPPPRVPRAHT